MVIEDGENRMTCNRNNMNNQSLLCVRQLVSTLNWLRSEIYESRDL